MNILIVTQYFWPETFLINDIAIYLVSSGHNVTVLTGIPNYPVGKFFKGFGLFKMNKQNYKGIRIYRVPIIPRGKSKGINLFLNYLSYSITSSLLGPILCKGSFDSILVYQLSPVTVGLPAIILKKIKKSPIIFWIQDIWPESLTAVGGFQKKGLIYKMIGILVKYIYSQTDRILIQSEAFRSSIRKYWKGDLRNLLYFPNFAEAFYKPIQFDENSIEFLKLPKGFKIIFAGNIGEAQDFNSIIKAAKILERYEDIQWIILGDGRSKEWAEREIIKLGLKNVFHFMGRHPVEKMPLYFSCADVLLVTLKKDPIFSLTIPSKIQSYLACGKPIIAGLDGEGARIVEEAGAGISSPSEDPYALSESVLKIYNLSEYERNKIGLAGRKYFKDNFERSLILNRLEKLIKEVACE